MFGPYRIRGMKEVALVLDCTVLPENKTGKEFNCGSDCFSGKYKIYCVKVEVGVNPKTGTASTVSKVHGGAVHDYVVFREHYSQFAAHLEGGKITADSAYIGATIELGTIITKPVWTPELAAHRVIVKRFFGPDATNEHQTQIKEKKGKSSGDQKVVLAMNEDTRISSISERDEASANSSSVLFPPIQNLYSSSNETSSSSTTQPASSASPQPPTTILISDQTTPSHSSELQSSQETFMNEGVISTNTSHLTSSPTSIFSQPSTSSSIETHPSFHSSQPTLGKQKPSSLLSQPRSLNLEQLMPSKKIHCHHSSIHPPSSTQFIQTEHNQSPDNDCLCIAKAPAKSCKNQKVPSSKQYQHKRTVLEYLLNVNSS
ncbi:uncharacterized protein MONOS_5494 [Monocercomonoides exilis]|uniref:uncharacterized protein n=1 Tax=Monocercomonoides exilis TaxID=2049356 RepID=UPI00355AC675|nr:hypothetical protein MONOS_5494 [Monocercomonoides exilis]|eukprot:MONOS_5494.1-p1 / transcript=MONOS_5494.1 / gene=MONOS_5494 / organism=Monocercomonoides_exilis_PA203 / gene_product=unspecified product / transcript_product=unspecified product / location=Mono_scaffold00161:4253-5870(+) / protein_length=372 / sequence_SO=supercontig / SO=protein_coding / is_pseudo=false